MLTGQQVEAYAREAADRALENDERPILVPELVKRERRIPFLGDYTPSGWTSRTPESLGLEGHGVYDVGLFVDTSGFGKPDEPALTVAEMENLVVGVQERFGLTVHPRSIERALARRKKKRR